MEFWFSELHTGNVKLSIKIEKQLFSGESEYQRIDVFDSEEFGKFISLDGEIVFSEKDEFIYDEMVTHVPMAVHPCVKDVLIIGGGDGGVAKELLQYDCVEHIDVVETDEMFVEVSRKFFPEVACALDDPRVEVHYDDGLRFLRNKKAKYDLIINDSTDPFGHTEGLFTKEFYGSCYSALKEDGIMVYQHGSPFYDEDELACRSMQKMHMPCSAAIKGLPALSRSAVFIRRIFQPVRPDTGSSASLQRNIIPSRISSPGNGMH